MTSPVPPHTLPDALPAPTEHVGEAEVAEVAGARRPRWGTQAPARPPVLTVLAMGGVVLLGLLVLTGLGEVSGHVLLIPSMAGTMALVAAVPTFALAQPRNVVLGQGIAAVVGLVIGLVDHSLWAAALAASVTVVITLLARCGHAPAAATAVLATVTADERGWFLACSVVAAVAIVATAAAAARCTRQEYPAYWW